MIEPERNPGAAQVHERPTQPLSEIIKRHRRNPAWKKDHGLRRKRWHIQRRREAPGEMVGKARPGHVGEITERTIAILSPGGDSLRARPKRLDRIGAARLRQREPADGGSLRAG